MTRYAPGLLAYTPAAFLLVVAGVVLSACSHDPSSPSAENLVGIWGALEYEYTSHADTARTIDLVQEAGATYSIELITGGSYRWRLNTSTHGTQRGTGTYEVEGDRLRLTPSDGGPGITYRLRFNGIFLRLRTEDASFDFDGDGTPEPASLRLLLDRF